MDGKLYNGAKIHSKSDPFIWQVRHGEVSQSSDFSSTLFHQEASRALEESHLTGSGNGVKISSSREELEKSS